MNYFTHEHLYFNFFPYRIFLYIYEYSNLVDVVNWLLNTRRFVNSTTLLELNLFYVGRSVNTYIVDNYIYTVRLCQTLAWNAPMLHYILHEKNGWKEWHMTQRHQDFWPNMTFCILNPLLFHRLFQIYSILLFPSPKNVCKTTYKLISNAMLYLVMQMKMNSYCCIKLVKPLNRKKQITYLINLFYQLIYIYLYISCFSLLGKFRL